VERARRNGPPPWSEPQLETWERQEALRVVAAIAAAVERGDFDRNVDPLLRRLTQGQRVVVHQALILLDRTLGEPPER
jgi:hypothetical protein